MARWLAVVMAAVIAGLATAAAQAPERFPWPDGKRVAVSLSFDDGRASQVEGGAALLDRHGVKATFYVTPGAVEARLAGWKAIAVSPSMVSGRVVATTTRSSDPSTG